MQYWTFLFVLMFQAQSFATTSIELTSCENKNCLLAEFDASSEDIEESENSEETLDVRPKFKGAYSSYISEQCHYRKLEHFFSEAKKNQDLGNLLSNWLLQCEKELSRFNSNSVFSMLNLSSIDYAFKDNPKIQQVKITYDLKTVVSGLLVLKDHKKRPLVIVKNGVFGNAEDTSTVRQMLMHLSEEAPFHVLILGNLTGDDFIKDNGYVSMGGFEEGRQIHKVVESLLSEFSPVKPYIHDIHMIGVSLGGNAALFSSLYNESVEEDKKIKSHIAYCPVVSLEKSLNHIYNPKALGVAVSFITKRILYDLLSFVPHLRDILGVGNDLTSRKVKKVLVNATLQSIQQRTAERPWDMSPFIGAQITSEQEMWYYNDFNNFIPLVVQSPLLVVHSSNDFIVRSKDNTNSIRNIASEKSNVGFVNLNQGGHCAFSISYGWPTFSRFLQKYILSHSDYSHEEEELWTQLRYIQKPLQNPRYRFSKYEWVYNDSKKSFDLNITYRQDHMLTLRGNERCVAQDYRFSDVSCYQHRNYNIEPSVFSDLGIEMPKTKFDVSRVTRILNTHVTPVTSTGEVPYGKGQSPSHLIYKKQRK